VSAFLTVGLTAGCSGELPLHNPKPSPYGHGDRGTLTVRAPKTVCWRIYAQQQQRLDRRTGCGNYTLALHRYGFFPVFVTKTDSTPGRLEAAVTSGGQTLHEASTTVPNGELNLSG
jgi:hypothetical protein